VGYNSYGHPADETLARLASLGAQVRRTDLDGPITITLRDGTVAVP
jgi:competence protein ComEC